MKSEVKDLKKKLSLAVKGLKGIARFMFLCDGSEPCPYCRAKSVLAQIERVGKEK